jgi:hypothetical protein
VMEGAAWAAQVRDGAEESRRPTRTQGVSDRCAASHLPHRLSTRTITVTVESILRFATRSAVFDQSQVSHQAQRSPVPPALATQLSAPHQRRRFRNHTGTYSSHA